MSDLLQILKGTGVRPRGFFYANGALADIDSAGVPTVTVTTPSGTTSNPTATKVAATTGTYEFTLAPQAECTFLTVTWAGPIGGVTETITTYIEALGNLLFTIGELRAMKVAGGSTPKFASTTDWPDARLHDARTAILGEWTRILGFPPVPRFFRTTIDGNGHTAISVGGGILVEPRLLSITINGAAQSVSNYAFNDESQLESVANYGYGTPFTWGRRNIVVEWVHGWPRVEGKGAHMAMMMAAAELDPGVFTSQSTVSMPDGSTYTYEPSETGRAGFVRHTGIKAVDKYLNGWAQVGIPVA